MNNSVVSFCRFAVVVAWFSIPSAVSLRAQEKSPDAHQIMESVYSQDTSKTMQMRASFETFDKQGKGKKKEFVYRRLGRAGQSSLLVDFTAPEEIRGVKLLSIAQPGADPKQYLYTPATERARSVASQERSARFIGTDFTYEDIAERDLQGFSYRMIGDAEVVDGHKTWKIVADATNPSGTQYKYIYYWVAQDAPVILHAEFYDLQGKEVRVLHASQIKHVSGIWGARRTEMSTPADGTRTVLSIDDVKFNVKLDEKLFTPEGLEGSSAETPK
jgi:hypothetical protein